MTAATSSDSTRERWWLDEERHVGVASFIQRTVVLLAVITWCAVIVALVVVGHSRRQRALDHELMFASALGLALPEAVAPIVAASGGEALLVESGHTRQTYLGPDSPQGQRYDRWRTRVRNVALSRATDRQFESIDPDGRRWHHTRVPTTTDRDLIFSARQSPRLDLGDPITAAVLGTAVSISLGLGLSWRVLSRRLSRSIGVLVEGGEDLLLRGSLRPEIRQAVMDLPVRPAELHRLGEQLDRIGTDFRDSTRRNESLLAASNALGSLLDPKAVLARSMELLQLLLGIDRSAILQYDPRTRLFRPVTALGHDEDYARDLAASAHDPAMPSVRATRELVPIQVPDIEAEVVSPDLRERGRRHGYRSLLAVPLANDLEHPTVLVLHTAHPRSYSFDEIELCKSFASVSGAALRNAELYARTDERLQEQTSALEAIIDSVDQGLVVESADGDIVFTNATMSGLVASVTGEEIRTGRTEELVARLVEGDEETAGGWDLVRSLEPGPDSWVDIDLRCRDGRQCLFRVRTFPVRDSRGVEVGRGYTWTDVSRDRELERMKEGLLAAVSHEFRTPLALIKGYATTLLADDVEWEPVDSRRFLEMMSGEADRLTDLVQRLLDMRRIDAGMVELDLMPTGIETVVGAAIEGVPHKPGRIVVRSVPDGVVDCDAVRLTTALRNLIENACRYSPDDERVTVAATFSTDSVQFTVGDRGPGIDPAVRDHIFDMFFRGHSGFTGVDRRASPHGNGVGLGLAIAKGFVEAHHGSLGVEDRLDGPGTVFRITLPSECSDARAATTAEATSP